MRLNSRLQPPEPPYLSHTALPVSCHARNRLLNGNLQAMSSHLEEFCEAAGLRDFCAQQQSAIPDPHLFGKWQFLAAKQCIIALYNYREAMDAVHRIMTRPPWSTQANTKELEATKKAFRAEFPNTRELRQTVLHDAERHATETRFQENSIKDGKHLSTDDGSTIVALTGGSKMIIRDVFVDNRYVSNFNGSVVEIDLSVEKIERLISLTRSYYRALHLAATDESTSAAT